MSREDFSHSSVVGTVIGEFQFFENAEGIPTALFDIDYRYTKRGEPVHEVVSVSAYFRPAVMARDKCVKAGRRVLVSGPFRQDKARCMTNIIAEKIILID